MLKPSVVPVIVPLRRGRSKFPVEEAHCTLFISPTKQRERAAEFNDVALHLESEQTIRLLTDRCPRRSLNAAVSGRESHTCLTVCNEGKTHLGLCSGCTFISPLMVPDAPLQYILLSLERALTLPQLLSFTERLRSEVICFSCSLLSGRRVGHYGVACLISNTLCFTCGMWKEDQHHARHCSAWFPSTIPSPTCHRCLLPQRVSYVDHSWEMSVFMKRPLRNVVSWNLR